MKIKLFTKSHNPELLNKMDKSQRFTADEHSSIVEQEFSEVLSSKESVIREYLSKNESKLILLAYLIRFAYRYNARKILFLGAGMCVIEEFLRQALPEDSIVVATDFDKFYINNAQRFFSKIVAMEFDFVKDDVRTICDATKTTFDVAFFLGSSYVMDDDEHIRILNQLKKNHVKMVLDLTPTLIPYRTLPSHIFQKLCALTRSRREKWHLILCKNQPGDDDRGKFHGFMRTREEFRNIYKKAGWTLKEETAVGSYNYVAILENI